MAIEDSIVLAEEIAARDTPEEAFIAYLEEASGDKPAQDDTRTLAPPNAGPSKERDAAGVVEDLGQRHLRWLRQRPS